MTHQRNEATAISAESRQLSRKRTELESNATFLTFESGLYAIDFRAAAGSMSDVGLPLPCARLEPVIMPSSPGRAFVSMTPEGGWLSRGTAAAHILVVGGRAGAVLTIYRPTDGTPMPEVHFRAVVTGQAATGQTAPAPASQPGIVQPDQPANTKLAAAKPAPVPLAATEPGAAAPEGALLLTVHVEGMGDRTERSGAWVGDTAGQRSIEGFSLTLPAGVAASEVEYQGIMGEDWRTPWFEAGAFCGSRGLQLPLLGFRLRLVGDAAARFECRAYGQFARHGAVGPVGSGEDCHASNMPLTAMRVDFLPRETPAAPAPAAAKPARARRAK